MTDPRYDYICFVRKGTGRELGSGTWKIREIPADIQDNRLLSRYAKTHPEELLADYSASVWIDGNIAVRSSSFYQLLDELFSKGVEIAIGRHPWRDCAYDEAYAVLSAGKAGYAEMARVVDFLSSEGFPRHAGLFENNVIMRSNKSEAVRKFDRMWWNCISNLSRRDQLSLVYCAQKAGVKITPLFPVGTNVRDCEWVTYVRHDHAPQRSWVGKKWNGLKQAVSKCLLRRKLTRI